MALPIGLPRDPASAQKPAGKKTNVARADDSSGIIMPFSADLPAATGRARVVVFDTVARFAGLLRCGDWALSKIDPAP
jgi:hypothetical protein